MSRETVSIRTHDQILDERCDQAHVPVTRGGRGYFCGMVLGRHVPTDVVAYAHIDTADVAGWLDRHDYVRDPDTDPSVGEHRPDRPTPRGRGRGRGRPA